MTIIVIINILTRRPSSEWQTEQPSLKVALEVQASGVLFSSELKAWSGLEILLIRIDGFICSYT